VKLTSAKVTKLENTFLLRYSNNILCSNIIFTAVAVSLFNVKYRFSRLLLGHFISPTKIRYWRICIFYWVSILSSILKFTLALKQARINWSPVTTVTAGSRQFPCPKNRSITRLDDTRGKKQGAQCSNLRSFANKCTALKKVLVLGLFGPPAVIPRSNSDLHPGQLCPVPYSSKHWNFVHTWYLLLLVW